MMAGGRSIIRASELSPGDHVCLIYDSFSEYQELLRAYVEAGLSRNDRVLHIFESLTSVNILTQLLGDAGVDVASRRRAGQLVFVDASSLIRRLGGFEAERMLRYVRDEEERALREGFGALRFSQEMAWIAQEWSARRHQEEYEGRLDQLVRSGRSLALCQYCKSSFSPELLLSALSTHGYAVHGGQICGNPHYIKPEDFLGPERSRATLDNWLGRIADQSAAGSQTAEGPEAGGRQTGERQAGVMAMVTPEGKWAFIDESLCKLLGYSRSELIGRSWTELAEAADAARCAEQLHQVVEGKRNGILVDVSLSTRAGSPVRVCVSGRCIRRFNGSAGNIYLRVEAATDVKRDGPAVGFKTAKACEPVNGELASATEELEAFTYRVSHDLKAPIRHIRVYSELLMAECADRLGETGRKYLERLKASGDRMEQLIEALMVLSKSTRGELRSEPVDLSETAESIVEGLRETTPGRNVVVKISSGLKAVGDGRLLRAVLENLISNAWKFTRAGSPAVVEVGQTVREGRAVFFVRDNGVGFDASESGKIFQPFYRLHSQGNFEGNGIGLATVERIVQRHSGAVWAESEPGRGATFYFSLGQSEKPASRPPQVETKQFDGKEEPLAGGKSDTLSI